MYGAKRAEMAGVPTDWRFAIGVDCNTAHFELLPPTPRPSSVPSLLSHAQWAAAALFDARSAAGILTEDGGRTCKTGGAKAVGTVFCSLPFCQMAARCQVRLKLVSSTFQSFYVGAAPDGSKPGVALSDSGYTHRWGRSDPLDQPAQMATLRWPPPPAPSTHPPRTR